jgi:hypothetical protein
MTARDATSPSGNVFARQFELLTLELTLINNEIKSLDEITRNVKQWAIVAWTGSLGAALGNPALKPALWATAFLPLSFWLVDASFRRIQRTFIVRVEDIADYVNSPEFEASAAAQTPMAFELLRMRTEQGVKTDWLSVMRFRTVATLYVLMMLGSLGLGLLIRLGKM